MILEFKQILEEISVLSPKKHILLGVSGGVDSVALFHLMQAIDKKHRPQISIAHINHQLREASDQDEAFVRNLADSYQIPFYSYTWKKTDHPTSGFEEAARKVRYNFFKKIMDKYGQTLLMTAHHQDDQVETILMKLARGSSLEQLTGIQLIQPFYAGQLMRPLLPFSKEKIYEYVSANKIDYVEDATNQSLDYTRNRYRNQIIPLIKKENAQFNEHVEQTAKDIRDLLEISKQPINEKYRNLIHVNGTSIFFNYKEFFKLDEPMQRAILKKVFKNLYQNSEDSYKTAYIEMVRSWLITGEVNTRLDLLNDFTVRKDYKNVIFEKEGNNKTIHSDEEFLLEKINECV